MYVMLWMTQAAVVAAFLLFLVFSWVVLRLRKQNNRKHK
jgi:hypothetical protein